MVKVFLTEVKSKIGNIYLAEWHFFKSNLCFRFTLLLLIFLASLIFLFLLVSHHPDIADMIKRRGEGLIMELRNPHGQLDPHALEKMMGFFIHNLRACLLTIIVGVIPFLFLPVFFVIFSGCMHAVFFMASKLLGLGVFSVYLTTVFPHAIFEYLGVLYSASLGTFLCTQLSKKVVPKRRKDSLALLTVAKHICRSYILVITPLFVIAAIVEVLITPLLG
jgi:stage II sporulation protein M